MNTSGGGGGSGGEPKPVAEFQLQMIDVSTCNDCIRTLKTALNKACRTGGYELEETFGISTSINYLTKVVECVDTNQKIMIQSQLKKN